MENENELLCLDDLISEIINHKEYERLLELVNNPENMNDVIQETVNKALLEKYEMLNKSFSITEEEKNIYKKILEIKKTESYKEKYSEVKKNIIRKYKLSTMFLTIVVGFLILANCIKNNQLIFSLPITTLIIVLVSFVINMFSWKYSEKINKNEIKIKTLLELIKEHNDKDVDITYFKLKIINESKNYKSKDELKNLIYSLIKNNNDQKLTNEQIAQFIEYGNINVYTNKDIDDRKIY